MFPGRLSPYGVAKLPFFGRKLIQHFGLALVRKTLILLNHYWIVNGGSKKAEGRSKEEAAAAVVLDDDRAA
jgi:hypothetical protein